MALDLVLKVHPVALMQILDAYERRNMDSFRVIGTLLGRFEKGVVVARNAFCVPHTDYLRGVEVHVSYAVAMFEYHAKVNKEEVIVGWFSTGNEVTAHSSVIHDYYSRECSNWNPIHLTLDTTLQDFRKGVRAYINKDLGTPHGKLGWVFTPVPVEVISYEPEPVSYSLLQKTIAPQQNYILPTDLQQIVQATGKLKQMIDNMMCYVDEVIQGKRQGDSEVGRALLDVVQGLPKISSEQVSNMFNLNVKDLLMVLSLAQLVETQLQLNEKLTFLTEM